MGVTICGNVARSASPILVRSEFAHRTRTAESGSCMAPAGRLGIMDINGMEQR
jgi:hypothetical protein